MGGGYETVGSCETVHSLFGGAVVDCEVLTCSDARVRGKISGGGGAMGFRPENTEYQVSFKDVY